MRVPWGYRPFSYELRTVGQVPLPERRHSTDEGRPRDFSQVPTFYPRGHAAHDIRSMRALAGQEFALRFITDKTMLLNFRQLLEPHDFGCNANHRLVFDE